jgi:hypothetical protein
MKHTGGILFLIFSILLFSQLTGCISEEQTPSDAQYFYGRWAGKLNEGTSSEINLSYQFYKNKTYLYTIGAQQALGSWELTDGHLVLTIAEKSEPFNYTFSDNYTTLLLDPVKFDFSYTVYKQ